MTRRRWRSASWRCTRQRRLSSVRIEWSKGAPRVPTQLSCLVCFHTSLLLLWRPREGGWGMGPKHHRRGVMQRYGSSVGGWQCRWEWTEGKEGKKEEGKEKSIGGRGRENILWWTMIISCINASFDLNHQITKCMVQLVKKGVSKSSLRNWYCFCKILIKLWLPVLVTDSTNDQLNLNDTDRY